MHDPTTLVTVIGDLEVERRKLMAQVQQLEQLLVGFISGSLDPADYEVVDGQIRERAHDAGDS
jgi:hypothetical protein